MRCLCCNRALSDYESVLRHPVTNDFLDICTKCLKDIPVTPVEPDNLEHTDVMTDEEFIPETEEYGYYIDPEENE